MLSAVKMKRALYRLLGLSCVICGISRFNWGGMVDPFVKMRVDMLTGPDSVFFSRPSIQMDIQPDLTNLHMLAAVAVEQDAASTASVWATRYKHMQAYRRTHRARRTPPPELVPISALSLPLAPGEIRPRLWVF
jgi:hypothetical protein